MSRKFLALLTMMSLLPISVSSAVAQNAGDPMATTARPAGETNPMTAPILVEASNRQYRINPGDQIEIYVWGEERLQRSVKVLPDGTLAFPLVGQMAASGLLPRELESMISQRLQTQYRGQVPQVTVSVVAPLGLQFSVMGKVKTPGSFSPGRYVNVLEALSFAGGPITFANLENILIYRKGDGEALSIIRVRLGSYFKSGTDKYAISPQEIPSIQSGDTVIVP